MVDSELNSSSLSLTLMCCRSVCFHTNGSFLKFSLKVKRGTLTQLLQHVLRCNYLKHLLSHTHSKQTTLFSVLVFIFKH